MSHKSTTIKDHKNGKSTMSVEQYRRWIQRERNQSVKARVRLFWGRVL